MKINRDLFCISLGLHYLCSMIDRATVDKILDATNIVDVVSDFVNLRKAGVNYKGLCPFHDDTTPSFMVSPSKQICKCFACGKGGTAVSFLMEHEQITYTEALRWLARKYNIEIEERELTDEERRQQSERESMFIINEWAKDYFHGILKDDPDGIAIGKQYFRSRGIRDDIIEKFQLGYAPQKRDALALAAQKAGYKAEFLVKTGLCFEVRNEKLGMRNDDFSLRDRYAGRVIFPWLNVSGKVVAFGGRVLDSRTKGVAQKYVNSPDSDIYHKERELYGIFQAKHAIAKQDCVYMVEGYTDVIAMHQCGLENVVANSGTALSVYQIRLLHRFTSNIVLLYDGDEAGIHAALRGTDMLLQEGMNIKVLVLPDGDDPDSFSRKHNAEEFRNYIQEHQTDFIQFKTDLMLRGVTDPIKRSEAIGSIVKSISVIPDPIKRDTYLHDCASRLGVKEQTLINSMNQNIREYREEKRKEMQRREESGERRVESREWREGSGERKVESGEEPQGTTPSSFHSPLSSLHSPLSSVASSVERLIAQVIIRHGDEVLFDNLETEDGGTVSLTVAQYIDYDLSQDGLQLSDERYRRILAEAVEHSGESGFKAETYFVRHPDPQISQLAADLAISRYQLSPSMKVPQREGDLARRVTHLVLDFRMDIVEHQLKELDRQLHESSSDMSRVMQIMQQIKQTQELRNALARQLGNDVMA
jgi:DNA primase